MLASRIDSRFVKHDVYRICQGDIIRDLCFQVVDPDGSVAELQYPYVVVMTQDCDLQQSANKGSTSAVDTAALHNQFLPNVLLTPAFPAEAARSGDHLLKIFSIKQERINSDTWKLVSKNREDRYHYLSGKHDMQVPELLIDFKHYFTLPYDILFADYPQHYLSTVNELFREDLSIRFCNYLARIGLPDLP